MIRTSMILCAVLLAGCSENSQPAKHETTETLSPRDYQECIQAAKSGDGQESTEKCDKVVRDAR